MSGEGDDFLDGVTDESEGSQDTIDCGDGFDEVLADEDDIIVDEAACEVINGNDDVASARQGRERSQARRSGGR